MASLNIITNCISLSVDTSIRYTKTSEELAADYNLNVSFWISFLYGGLFIWSTLFPSFVMQRLTANMSHQRLKRFFNSVSKAFAFAFVLFYSLYPQHRQLLAKPTRNVTCLHAFPALDASYGYMYFLQLLLGSLHWNCDWTLRQINRFY